MSVGRTVSSKLVVSRDVADLPSLGTAEAGISTWLTRAGDAALNGSGGREVHRVADGTKLVLVKGVSCCAGWVGLG